MRDRKYLVNGGPRAAGLLLLSLSMLAGDPALAQDTGDAPLDAPAAEVPREGHPILLYVPNRIFDVLDVLRLRVRVGPGFAVSARATEPLSANAGAYASIFVGSPGPRGEPRLNLPAGIEAYAGAGLSVLDAETERRGPGYGPLEIGAGFQAAVLGLDLGIDPLELVDLALGLVLIDLRDDDL